MSAVKKVESDKASRGRRLTSTEKKEIRSAPEEVTNTQLAERFNTTLNTIGRYRSRKSQVTTTTAATKDQARFAVSFEKGALVLRLSKKDVLQLLLGE